MAEGVVPAVLIERTVLHRAECVLPVVTSIEVGTLNDTSTGEAEATGFHISQCLHEVLTQATLAAFPGVDREE